MKKIVFAAGCFWGVEAYFSRIEGILKTKVGYANGHVENPTYEMVCNSYTGHAEACYIEYDEDVVSLDTLLAHFWKVIDPIAINRQGPDVGYQYRSAIYYIGKEDIEIIQKTKDQQQEKYDRPIATEIEALSCFYDAEEYHQKYLEKNPKGYCHIKF